MKNVFRLAGLCTLSLLPAVAGAVTPDKYLEYVQSTSDLYVNIDYTPKSNTVVEARVEINDIDRNNTIFCSRPADNKTFTLFFIKANNGERYFRWDYTSASRWTDDTQLKIKDQVVDLRASGQGLYLWGRLAEATAPVSFSPGAMILFASYKSGNDVTNGLTNYARMKLFFFKAYDYDDENGRLVLSVDLVPAEDGGVAGLYDRVRKRFFSSAVSNKLVAGGETTVPADLSLREDVLGRGYSFTPGGRESLAGYGFTNLFDGVQCTTATNSYAQNSRWIGNDTAEQHVDVEPGYFSSRAGTLVSYVLHKCSMKSYAPNSRAPISWRIEGVLSESADDDAWVVIDARTDFAWPDVDASSYSYNADELPSEGADLSAKFAVSGARQAPYRRLRFVPTNSEMKKHSPDEANLYSLMEVDFRVMDAAAGMDAGTVVVAGAPDIYGESVPSYGMHAGVEPGGEIAFSVPETSFANAEETLRAICTGWKVYTYNSSTRLWDYDENDPDSHGSGNSFAYTHGSVAAKVEWQFKMQAYVDVSPFGHGTATGSGWYDIGSEAEITATADENYAFRRWEGLPEGVDGSATTVSFTVTGPVAAQASIGGTRYVAKTGSDANDGLAQATAFLTINHALADLGPAGGTVYVGEGTYTETNGVDLAAINVTNEVALVGLTGRAEDVRVTYKEEGSTRHVLRMDNARASARFMTFTGGRATTVSYGNSDTGMNVRIGSKGGTVEDCIIRGAHGQGWNQHGLGLYLYGGRASRCRIVNNSFGNDNGHGGAGLGASAGLIEDCLIVSNSCHGAGAVYLTGTATMLNCTVAANTGVKYAGVYVDGANVRVVNCAIQANVANSTPSGKVYLGTTTGFVNCVADLEIPGSVDCVVAQPLFRDLPNGDFRPAAGSALIDAGASRGDWGATSATDVAGATRVVGTAVDIGCHENQQDALECGFAWNVASAIFPGEVTLAASAIGATGSETYSWSVHNESTGADVAVDPSANAALANLPCGLYSVVLTVSDGGDSASHAESGVFQIGPRDVYAKSGNPSAAFPYSTSETAAADIATAIAAAVDGSTVHVAKGAYGITAQVVVDKGIALAGETGRPRDVVVRRTSGNVRNLYVNHPDAWVSGMTFENGLIAGHGGCLNIDGRGGVVSNCVFRGGRTTANNDYSAGGVLMSAGLLTHCEITDCTAVPKDVSSSSQCRVLKLLGGRGANCLMHGNVAAGKGALVNLEVGGAAIENFTIVDDVVMEASSAVYAKKNTAVRNCAIFVRNGENAYASCSGYDEWNAFWPLRYFNCVTSVPIAEYTTGNGGKGWYYGQNCVTNATEAECFLNPSFGDYRVAKDGPLYEAGMDPVVFPATDFAGNPRLNRHAVDVGCYEYISTPLTLVIK